MAEQGTPAGLLRREWQAFWLAVGFLTRVPMPLRIDYSPQLMNQCSLYFPLVGLLLGALYAGLYSLFILLWTPLVAVLLVLAMHLWLTGAFHEDGLADSVDALGGGADREARLTIMKDSSIGTYGSVALLMALALKAALLVGLEQVWLALLVVPCVSRLTPLLLMRLLPYVTRTEQTKTSPVAESFSGRRLALATLGVMLVALVSGTGFVSLIAVSLITLYWGWTLKRQLGGYTGDALGASVVLTELLWLLALAAPGLGL
ncbi:adenosylcobinamide-GDP ribazoletransferase [Natronospirillum operosum]|uniref:Adenosylcobinamide-GDP ribazoletransferase n=1 Tax=Natronospirillum operosum TaxID=2759953 RepID=A0A4Z0WCC5_9GAMM|nr:adenosylcobinamide-GDP ribazoletransferase [Natronospirillum operosum]TGG92021.1 adenosylcobinamide-GDP ribazoletransferase [Natronospirillum operosum]